MSTKFCPISILVHRIFKQNLRGVDASHPLQIFPGQFFLDISYKNEILADQSLINNALTIK